MEHLEQDSSFMDKYSRQIGTFGLETMAKVCWAYHDVLISARQTAGADRGHEGRRDRMCQESGARRTGSNYNSR